MSLNIVLVEPEIPQNTGNIARTCAATGSRLHLVKPLGFSVDDRHLKRAGLDYWSLVDIFYYDSFEELKNKYPDGLFYYSTTKGGKKHTDAAFKEDCFIVFGKETAGLPKPLLDANRDFCIRVPMIDDARSLNLANSVAIVVYEALRQIGFPGMR
ncbi:MAG: tRNA (uridine(34)/cytosine(34)/5-carboxymethylaminomethyluridine(34)-2'-O)-methyltransferase TrmL [Pseudomonadota bacterium]